MAFAIFVCQLNYRIFVLNNYIMKHKKFKQIRFKELILFAAIFLIFQSNSNVYSQTLRNEDYSKITAAKQIVELAEGALIVRLKTGKSSIEAMRNSGRIKEADKKELEVSEYNISIYSAFRKAFDFCPVYFIYSDDSQYVLRWQLDKLVFLDDSLNPKSQVEFDYVYIYTAEFGKTEKGNLCSFDDPEKGSSGSEFIFDALRIMDSNFRQLCSPFPWYSKINYLLVFKRDPESVVENMNRMLHDFYKKCK
jgi:hypothetical protein